MAWINIRLNSRAAGHPLITPQVPGLEGKKLNWKVSWFGFGYVAVRMEINQINLKNFYWGTLRLKSWWQSPADQLSSIGEKGMDTISIGNCQFNQRGESLKQLHRVISNWPILGWNVSKSWLQTMDFFANYANVAMQNDNVTFYARQIIKVTSGFNLK